MEIEHAASLPETKDLGDFRSWTGDFTKRHLSGGERRSLAGECVRYANKVTREIEQDTRGGGDTYNIIDSHASFGDKAQHAGRDMNTITPEPKEQKGGWGLVKKISLILGIIVSLIVIVGAYNKYIRKDKPAVEQTLNETPKTEPNDPSLIKVNSQQGSALIDGVKMTAPQITFSSETDGEITITDSVSETKGTKIDVNEGGQIKLKDGALIDQN